jgi:hypothetical protein
MEGKNVLQMTMKTLEIYNKFGICYLEIHYESEMSGLSNTSIKTA